MNLSQYLGKYIKVLDVDGDITAGKCICVTPAADNDPEIASIDLLQLGNYSIEIFENEVIGIEIIED